MEERFQPRRLTIEQIQEIAMSDIEGVNRAAKLAWTDLIDLQRRHTQSGIPTDIQELYKLALGVGVEQEVLDAELLRTYASQNNIKII